MFENRLIHWHDFYCALENNGDSYTDMKGLVTCPRCIDMLRNAAQQSVQSDGAICWKTDHLIFSDGYCPACDEYHKPPRR